MINIELNEQEFESLKTILYWELELEKSRTHKAIVKGLLDKFESYE